MRDRQYYASLGMSALAAIVTVGGMVSFSWALGWAGAAGLLAVVLSADNKVLYATRAGELADARHMSETGIYDFFRAVTRTAKKTP